MKKEGEEEEKEQEKLGKLEFSLDYNFTDSQVGPVWKQSRFYEKHSYLWLEYREMDSLHSFHDNLKDFPFTGHSDTSLSSLLSL